MFYNRNSQESYKGEIFGPFDPEEIDNAKDDLAESERLARYDKYGWDGVERDWVSCPFLLEEYEIETIMSEINKYIMERKEGKMITSDLNRAIACCAEMKLFQYEHYETGSYDQPEANIRDIIQIFADRACEIINEYKDIPDSAKDMLIFKNNVFYNFFEDKDSHGISVGIKVGNKAYSITVNGMDKEFISIQEESSKISELGTIFESQQKIYEIKDGKTFELIETRTNNTIQRDIENGKFEEISEISENGNHKKISSIVHYEEPKWHNEETKRIVESTREIEREEIKADRHKEKADKLQQSVDKSQNLSDEINKLEEERKISKE